VLSGSDLPLPWANSHRLDGMEAVAALKAQDGPNLVIQGSSTLYPQLLRQGLIDRIVTMTAPVVLGSGKRVFGQGAAPGAFKLVEHRVTSTGIAMATYDPSGPVETGSFATVDPSPAELERRERWKGEG
jgi:dihydrofolate reductase